MATINVIGNTFQGGPLIENLYEAPKVDFEKIVKELQEIKACLKQDSKEYEVVTSLEKDSKDRNWDGISSTIQKNMSSFASSALANLAGAYLSKLFQLG